MRIRRRTALVLAAAGVAALAFSSFYWPFPKGRLSPAPVVSLKILDRSGLLLREVLSDEGGRCRWLELGEISPRLLQAVIAAEDKAFFGHSGINPFAMIRAFIQNLRSGRVVSGASTITQQLVRNIYHRPRSLGSKVFEAWMAVRLEHNLSKNQILTQYLNRIPFGNQAFGIAAASRLYFGKPADQLSLAEAAFLAGLPRSPSLLNPYHSLKEAKDKQRRVLERMHRLGYIDADDLRRARAEPLLLVPRTDSFRAPHFCDAVLAGFNPVERRGLSAIRTTLDASLQTRVETLLASHVNLLQGRGISNGAAVVLDNATGEVLALVGSKDFFDDTHDGQVNGALALRQPGSTIKPFTYALALENGLTAATVIDDAPTRFSTDGVAYEPRNYDRRYHGPVLLRSALACSYNIPAVSVLSRLGTDRLYLKLKALGFESLSKDSDFYGLGLTLGDGEVTLLELAGAYSALARGGVFRPPRSVRGWVTERDDRLVSPSLAPEKRVFTPQAAYIVTDILADKDARVPSFGYHSPLTLPFPTAAKTGTSKDFRDNWTVGYTRRYTVAVWVGNFDGRPMANVSGITGCGPLFRDILLLLEKNLEPLDFALPEGLVKQAVCPLSGLRPNARCPGRKEEIFIRGTEPAAVCGLTHGRADTADAPSLPSRRTGPASTLRILFPRDGDVFQLDPVLRREFQSLTLRVAVPETADVRSVTWWVNGRELGQTTAPYVLTWELVPGSYDLRATARAGRLTLQSRTVRVTVVS
jgi:penicillin-binding protein 1C